MSAYISLKEVLYIITIRSTKHDQFLDLEFSGNAQNILKFNTRSDCEMVEIPYLLALAR